MTLRRGYADTRFGQLHYAEAGEGPVLLMLHQTPRSHDEFAELQPLLSDGFRTVAMDMLGFGLSAPAPPPTSIEAMAEAGWALLDALGVETAVLLGHHTGAAVAHEMAVQAPGRTAALALSAMPWVDAARRAGQHHVGVDTAQVRDDGGHLIELWSLRQPYYPAGRPDLLDRFIRDALAPGLDPAEGHRAVSRYPMDERIGAITAPVLLLATTGDPFAAAALPAVRRALTAARSVDVRELAGAQVPAMEQCTDDVARHVREFLADLV
jgi:pimeloyl-ACP methyl ester carboxylesterase